MLKRIIALAALVGVLVWSCSGNNPVGGGDQQEELNALAGGGRLAADDPIGGRHGSDSGGVPGHDPNWPEFPDTLNQTWRVVFSHVVDCTHQPSEQIITDSASWHQWWHDANACIWGDDTLSFPGIFFPDTLSSDSSMGHWDPPDSLMPDSSWIDPPGHPGGGEHHSGSDTVIVDTVPASWHGNPWTDSTRFDPPPVDFSRYIIAAIRVEFDSGAFCFRNVNITRAEMDGSQFVIGYEVTRLDGDCCGMVMAPILQGEGAPVVAAVIEKPSTTNFRFDRSEREYECWLPDPDDPITLDYTYEPCVPVQNEQLITDQATWEQWFADVHACDTILTGYPYPDTMLWIDTLGILVPDTIVAPPVPIVDFSRYAVIILSAEEQEHWGGGIWLTSYTNGSGGAIVEYTIMVPSESCPHMGGPPGHLTHTTAIRVLRPTNDQATWRQFTHSIECAWGDTVLIDPM